MKARAAVGTPTVIALSFYRQPVLAVLASEKPCFQEAMLPKSTLAFMKHIPAACVP